jgi:hypothetical protein
VARTSSPPDIEALLLVVLVLLANLGIFVTFF